MRDIHYERVALAHLELEGMSAWVKRGEVEPSEWAVAAQRVSTRFCIPWGVMKGVAFRVSRACWEACDKIA